jgi:hypothetical protein
MYRPYPTTAVSRRNKKPEEGVQILVARYLKKFYPDVSFHSDYAAGLHLTINQAKKRKAMNSERGWADMFIAYPSRGYHGLFLELKKDNVSIYVTKGPRKGELVADGQIAIEAKFLERMNRLGYLGMFAVGYAKAVDIIDWYFDRPKDDSIF